MKKILVIALLLIFVASFAACNITNVDFVTLEGERYVTDISMIKYSDRAVVGKSSFARFVPNSTLDMSDDDIDEVFGEAVVIEIGILIAEDVSRIYIDRVSRIGKTLKIYVSYPNNAYKSDRKRVTLIKQILVPKESVDGVTSVKVSLKLY